MLLLELNLINTFGLGWLNRYVSFFEKPVGITSFKLFYAMVSPKLRLHICSFHIMRASFLRKFIANGCDVHILILLDMVIIYSFIKVFVLGDV